MTGTRTTDLATSDRLDELIGHNGADLVRVPTAIVLGTAGGLSPEAENRFAETGALIAQNADAIAAAAGDISIGQTLALSAKDRPGDTPEAFSAAITGLATERAALPGSGQVTNDLGQVYSLVGAGVVLARNPLAISDDVWEVLARVRREIDPLDPSNHTVELVAYWLDQSFAFVSEQVLGQNTSMLASDGLVELAARISALDAAQNVVNPPAGAVYATFGVRQYGEDGTLTVETIRAKEVTDLHGLSEFDLSALVSASEAATTAAQNATASLDQTTIASWGDAAAGDFSSAGTLAIRYGAQEHDGLGGVWIKDTSDSTSAHQPPMVLVDTAGNRFKWTRFGVAARADLDRVGYEHVAVGAEIRVGDEGFNYKVEDAASPTAPFVFAGGLRASPKLDGGQPLNAEQFGMVGDGATDNTEAFQEALNWLSFQPNYYLDFPAGHFMYEAVYPFYDAALNPGFNQAENRHGRIALRGRGPLSVAELRNFKPSFGTIMEATDDGLVVSRQSLGHGAAGGFPARQFHAENMTLSATRRGPMYWRLLLARKSACRIAAFCSVIRMGMARL